MAPNVCTGSLTAAPLCTRRGCFTPRKLPRRASSSSAKDQCRHSVATPIGCRALEPSDLRREAGASFLWNERNDDGTAYRHLDDELGTIEIPCLIKHRVPTALFVNGCTAQRHVGGRIDPGPASRITIALAKRLSGLTLTRPPRWTFLFIRHMRNDPSSARTANALRLGWLGSRLARTSTPFATAANANMP